MSASNSWAEFAAVYCRTRAAFLEHEKAKSELKALDAGGRQGGIWARRPAKRSKSGAVSFDLLTEGAGHAAR